MSKLNAKSVSLRREGNEFFNQKCYYNAMLKYNESLCLAELDSETLGLAYANRSDIYFEMKLYNHCLKNINLAKQNKYPELNAVVLNEREEKCLNALKQDKRENDCTDAQQLFKLSYAQNKNITFVIDCLEMKNDSTYGRHIVTNKSLKVGDVVAIEEPFCKIVRDEYVQQICSWCFKSNMMDLIPCRSCTKAMFCSADCETKACQTFHKYECPVMEITSKLSKNLQMALRTLYVVLAIFDDSIHDLQKYILNHPEICTIFDVKGLDERSKFLAINSLIANDKIDIRKEVLEEISQWSSKLKEIWSTHGDFIAQFLHRQIQVATVNYHEIYSWPLKKGGFFDKDIDKLPDAFAYQRVTVSAGNGSYPFCSLLNHSCAPNVGKIFVNDKIVLIVQRPIEKGAQLFDNYGYHFTNMSKDCRQKELLKQYKFLCNCDACKHNWPILTNLKIANKLNLNKAKKVCRELKMLEVNRKKAMSKYKELCDIVNKNHKNFPSVEMCSIMESMAAYLEMSLKPSLQFV
ncbi:SET and MYND domain-containing protein 4 [Pseudolycoriella hygida]|uniref:SET and MYND domain-containing protein 4 n=1 Tax=Pseudolycoriella hygida TaxID=35572 RepID=A0A9Q0RUM9_9DIPT|nr:SET and MYND domain-containing protein 4 [Pseudolycoriella hygida]